MTELTTLPQRSAVPLEQTWDLESIFATPADWEAACQELDGMLPGLAAYQGRLAEGPQTLLEFLELSQQAGILMGKIITYAINACVGRHRDQAAAARAGQARSLMARFGAASAFFDPELMAIGFERLEEVAGARRPSWPSLPITSTAWKSARPTCARARWKQVLALAGDPFSGPYVDLRHAQQRRPDLQAGRWPPMAGSSKSARPASARWSPTPTGKCAAPPGRTTPMATWLSRTPTPPR